MNNRHLRFLKCTECGSGGLLPEAFSASGDSIVEGRLACAACGVWFRIEYGIADMLPLSLRRAELYRDFAQRHGIAYDSAATNAEGDKDKLHQMEFYAGDVDEYEEKLVSTGFWKALDGITLGEWMQRNLKPGQRALEIGCGSGRVCVRVAENGVDIIGLDISEEMLRRARKKLEAAGAADRATLLVGDGEHPPVIDGVFDACILHGMLHHVPNPDVAIRSAVAKLKPNGVIFTFDPHKSPVRPIFDWLMKIWKLYNEEAREEPLFRESQLEDWFSKAGVKADIKLTTYLPPHILYLLSEGLNRRLLKASDAVLNRIPGVRKWAGVVIGEGRKLPA